VEFQELFNGRFLHTGTLQVYNNTSCYILVASWILCKGIHTNIQRVW